MSAGPFNKGAEFLGRRIGQDALTIAELIAQGEAKDARIAELEGLLTPKQRERVKVTMDARTRKKIEELQRRL